MRKFLMKIYDYIVFRLPSSVVLLFHHVSDDPICKKSSCILDTQKFYDIINAFENYASLDETIKEPGKKKVAVTFDDGLQDTYDIAYPFLKSKNVPFTIYIIADFLDTEGYLTKEQLRELASDPLVTIGSHGLNHKVFTKMSTEEKKKEFALSKKIIEEIIGKEVTNFAYSHGAYDRETLTLAKGYKYAMSVASRPINVVTKLSFYRLPRFNIVNEGYEDMLKRVKKILNLL